MCTHLVIVLDNAKLPIKFYYQFDPHDYICNVNKGILYIILSGLFFMVVNFFVKLLGTAGTQDMFVGLQEYPAHELVLARSIVSFAISFVIIKRKKLPFFGNNKKWLLIRGIAGTIALTIFFYTIHNLPLAVASTVQYLSPIFTIIFAIVLLQERVKILQWFFVGMAFIGVSLIAVSKFYDAPAIGEQISFFWLGMGVIAAVFSGIAYTAIMKLRTTDEPITIVMYFPMIATPLMVILCLFQFTMPQGIEWLFLLIIGIFTQLAQIMLTKALHEGSASLIMPFQYLGAIYSYLIGFFLFDERLSYMIDLGIVLIVVSVIINVLLRNK